MIVRRTTVLRLEASVGVADLREICLRTARLEDVSGLDVCSRGVRALWSRLGRLLSATGDVARTEAAKGEAARDGSTQEAPDACFSSLEGAVDRFVESEVERERRSDSAS